MKSGKPNFKQIIKNSISIGKKSFDRYKDKKVALKQASDFLKVEFDKILGSTTFKETDSFTFIDGINQRNEAIIEVKTDLLKYFGDKSVDKETPVKKVSDDSEKDSLMKKIEEMKSIFATSHDEDFEDDYDDDDDDIDWGEDEEDQPMPKPKRKSKPEPDSDSGPKPDSSDFWSDLNKKKK